MLFVHLLIALLFALFGLACIVLVAIGLPGAWILIAAALCIMGIDWLWVPDGWLPNFSWWTIGAAAALAALGELLEFIASALGAKHGGASRRGMIGSIVGALIGGIGGTFVLPIIGSMIGAALGAGAGAILGELTISGRRLGETWRPAQGAAIGRLLGTIGKLPCVVAVWTILAIDAFWP